MIVQDFNYDKGKTIALELANEMVKNGLYSRFSLHIGKRVEKALWGCLGELAFAHWLDQRGVKYQKDERSFLERNTDDYDFLISGKVIDVKIALKSTRNAPNDRWAYGYPQEQVPSKKDYIVVGWIDQTRKEIGFYGWISGAQIAKKPIVKVNTFKGYPYMTPNHEFKWGILNKDFEAFLKLF
ncbi:hypothetical protein SAMN06295967_102213 [Belliella buryatensis]|uniref:Restriction endonuclease n=1 Tax=Belliella buryatensis TaxID=1500549 RepID=A0A239BAB0_9BACT|nr:hypothetical protein [Belliella buryatensis]SNS04348.1 hypothetical protein SAMN06295967_102213 [Belliella buryatensis]